MRAYINTHKDMGIKQCKISHFGKSMTSLKETEAWVHEELSFPVKTGIISLVDNGGLITIRFGFYGTTNELQEALKKVIRGLLGYGKESYSVTINIRDVTNCYDMVLRVHRTCSEGVASRKMFDRLLDYKTPPQLRLLSNGSSVKNLVYIEKQEGINPKAIEYEY